MMRDEGERTCPLCAEEMDLTDLQLKPCKCGYDICVWCWNQIIDLAEAQNTEGRCPACRRTYDKERIVGAATNCERVIPELFGEKKQKSQKGKLRVSSAESRKHLSSVRVIQRNLVYIVGLPMSLSDENMLEHREYFGQYGKVLKVSISRTATGAQQTSINNTFSVYITYAKEEEAVRCIQSVHNFILEGKPLRACFGTTKYCHAWLRNLSCSNPDCFYLHDIGTEDDSFSKDEIISAYTRSRVPQVISNSLHRRSGSRLPPPVDDFCNSSTSSSKIMVKNSPNNAVPHTKYLPPNGVSTRPNVLPAAASWGSRASNPLSASTSCMQDSSKQSEVKPQYISNIIPETCDQSSAWNDDLTEQLKFPENQIRAVDSRSSQTLEPSKAFMRRHPRTIASNSSDMFGFSSQSSAWNDDQMSEERCKPIFNGRPGLLSGDFEKMSNSLVESSYGDQITSAWDDDDNVIITPSMSQINNDESLIGRYEPEETLKSGVVKTLDTSLSQFPGEVLLDTSNSETSASNLSNAAASENTKENDIPQNDYTCFEQVDIPSNCTHGNSKSITTSNPPNVTSLCVNLSLLNLDDHQRAPAKQTFTNSPILREPDIEEHSDQTTALSLQKSSVVLPDNHVSGEPFGWTSELWKHFTPSIRSNDPNFPEPEVHDNQRGSTSCIVGQTNFIQPTQSSYIENASRATHEYNRQSVGSSKNIRFIDKSSAISQPFRDDDTIFHNEYQERMNNSSSNFETDYGRAANATYKGSDVDIGETNIISDFLSMDFDSWYANTTGENKLHQVLQNGKTNPSLKRPGSQDSQNSSQSRFSFARQENDSEIVKRLSHETENLQCEGNNQGQHGVHQNMLRNTETYTTLNRAQAQLVTQSDKNSVARANISAPPGFSVPNRAPLPLAPPGFSSQDRLLHSHGSTPSGLNMLQNPYKLTQLPNVLDDLEFTDPAILVCKRSEFNVVSGSRYFPEEMNVSENDLRYQLMKQQNMPAHEAHLNSGQAGDDFLLVNDSYYHKQFIGQNFGNMSHLTSRNSVMSNNLWHNWNEMQLNGSSLDPLENSRLHAYGNYYNNNEEHKFRMTDGGASGSLYGRSFGL